MKFKVWNEEDLRADAREFDTQTAEQAAVAFAEMDPNPDKYDEFTGDTRLLVERPGGVVERHSVYREVIVEFHAMLDRTRFDDNWVTITSQGEEFFWKLEVECSQAPRRAPCSEPSCPIHGAFPVVTHGPFESWDLAFENARSACSIPDDGREDPNC